MEEDRMSESSYVFFSRWAALPYPLRFHARSSSSSTIYPAIHAHPQLDAFEAHLCSELRRLQECGGYLSAEWLRQAMDVCLSVHSQVEELFPHIRQEVLGQNSKWVNEHLEDTVKLLDVCNALRETMSDIKQYQGALKLAVRCFQGNGPIGAGHLIRARTAFGSLKEAFQSKSRLDNCSSMLRRMGDKMAAGAATQSGSADFLEPIHASKALDVFVCGTLVAALSTKSRRSQPPPCAGQSAWAGALHSLHSKVKEDVEKRRNNKGGGGGARMLLQELEAVESSSSSVYDLVNKFINSKSVPLSETQAVELRQSVQALKKCIDELENGMAPFERQSYELFKVVVAGRMALLDVLGSS